jgi:hypothetical protein
MSGSKRDGARGCERRQVEKKKSKQREEKKGS